MKSRDLVSQRTTIKGAPAYMLLGILILVLGSLLAAIVKIVPMVTGQPMWTGFLPVLSIAAAIRSILSAPRKTRPVTASGLRLLLACLCLGIPLGIWFLLGATAVISFSTGLRPWHFVALPGLFLPLALCAVPAQLAFVVRRRYAAFPSAIGGDVSEARFFEGFAASVRQWSARMGLGEAPCLLRCITPGVSPHVFGLRRAYFGVPWDLPQIVSKLRATVPGDAQMLVDFMIVHELTHVEHRDHRLLTALSSFSRTVLPAFVLTAFALSIVGSMVVRSDAAVDVLLGIVLLLPVLFVLYWMMFIQLLAVHREREFQADQRAIELFRSMNAPTELICARRPSPLRVLFAQFTACPGPSPRVELLSQHPSIQVRGLMKRVRSWVVEVALSITRTHPAVESREAFLGRADDVERIFAPREFGITTGLAVVSLWFSMILVSRAMNFHDLFVLEFTQLWLVLDVLAALLIVPLRHMGGRPVSSATLMRCLWNAYAWSFVTTIFAMVAMAAVPMIVLRQGFSAGLFAEEMFVAHLSAVFFAWVSLRRLRELGVIGTGRGEGRRAPGGGGHSSDMGN